jgi:hypothetical protein
VVAHKLGVIDEQYVQTAGDPDAVAGRKVRRSGDSRKAGRSFRESSRLLITPLVYTTMSDRGEPGYGS